MSMEGNKNKNNEWGIKWMGGKNIFGLDASFIHFLA